MSEAHILASVRTGRGKARPGGGLATVPPLRLVQTLLAALAERTGLEPEQVDDVVLGSASQTGAQGGNLARTALLAMGWPTTVPGQTVNRFCASGVDAVATAAALVRSGQADLVVAGGVESVSYVPMFADQGPLWADEDVVEAIGSVHMGIAADVVATEQRFTREELDAYALVTHERAARARFEGLHDEVIVPVRDETGRVLLDRDEHIREDLTAATVANLKPAFAELGAAGQDQLVLRHLPELGEVRHLHTRATSPALADASALVLVGSATAAERTGIAPVARIVGSASAGADPVRMLVAGQHAVEKVVARAGLVVADLGVLEFAEAFAAMCLKIQRDHGLDGDVFNRNGGTIATGHAFGATGAILTGACARELARTGRRYGVAAVSGAAGLGSAVLLENVNHSNGMGA
ncbi:acetyl-CoA C-acyltransferase [Micromonospora sp. WMMA1363]|uniref:acetyl-CoA C-acyltransferase n=1 Tax=Micromonospora sp. WMMA1363 TaxID=3053985 RepID=UPI00259CFCE1|nr:acetyl-CoA C-acyltransferase [Micromonospora sp. WMMA1363]MDM4719529.1 acetyl-CoA C-acyltransferase [Micromonospora sp. WMMA1363]